MELRFIRRCFYFSVIVHTGISDLAGLLCLISSLKFKDGKQCMPRLESCRNWLKVIIAFNFLMKTKESYDHEF